MNNKLKNLPNESWKYVEGTNNYFVSNLQRIKVIRENGDEQIRKGIYNSDGVPLSLFSIFKKYWDIDIKWTGDLDGEEWKVIEDAADIEVSNKGRIRTTDYRGTGTKNLLKTWDCNGYIYTNYINNEGSITKTPLHRLIAQAFIPNFGNKPEIDHINTIRNDNRVENLRWTTREENFNNPISHNNRVIGQQNKKRNKA